MAAGAAEQLTAQPDGALGLPQRGSAVVAERIERADVGQRHDLVAAEAGAGDQRFERVITARTLDAGLPIVRAVVAEPAPLVHLLEHRVIVAPAFRTSGRALRRQLALAAAAGMAAGARNLLPGFLTKPVDVSQPETNRAVLFHRAVPVGDLHVDRLKADAAALRVLDERRRVIKPH